MSMRDTRRIEFLIRHLLANRMEPWPIQMGVAANDRFPESKYTVLTRHGEFEGPTLRKALDSAIDRVEEWGHEYLGNDR